MGEYYDRIGADFHDGSPKANDTSTPISTELNNPRYVHVLGSEYASEKARYVMELDLGISNLEKACAIAKRYEMGDAFQARTGNFRGDYTQEGLMQILDEICAGRPGITKHSIDELVTDTVNKSLEPKPNMLKVAAKGSYSLVKECAAHGSKIFYYPLLGIFPGDAQKWAAKKLDQDPYHYTNSSIIADLGITMAGGVLSEYNKTSGYTILTFGILSAVIKASAYCISNRNERLVFGSLVFTVPMYLVLGSFYAAKAVGKWIGNHYQSALQEEQQKLLEAKHQQEYDNAGVRVVTGPENIRVEQPKPEIVDEEVEDDLQENDRRLREKNG